MKSATDSYTVDLLEELAEYFRVRADVRDGPNGEQRPNQSMTFLHQIEGELERLSGVPGPNEVLELLRYFVAFHTPGEMPEGFAGGQMARRVEQAKRLFATGTLPEAK